MSRHFAADQDFDTESLSLRRSEQVSLIRASVCDGSCCALGEPEMELTEGKVDLNKPANKSGGGTCGVM
eukprot:s6342_g3.t1